MHKYLYLIVFQIKEIMEKLTNNGQIDLVKIIEKNHQVTIENRMKEKQIMSLVKTTNKLQDITEYLEKENFVLR